MTEWRECKLKDIADVVGGGTPSTSINEYWNGDIPWLTPKDLTGYTRNYISHGERFITKKGLENSSTQLLPKGTVLLTSRAPIGYVAIAENGICTNQGFKSLVPNPDKAHNLFLLYWLKGNIEYLQSMGTGTTFQEISGSVLKDINISLPPLHEQKAIAEVLSSLDDKIDLLTRQNKTLEDLAQAYFRKWFIEDADDNKAVQISDLIDFNPSRYLAKGTIAPYLEMANVSTSAFHPDNWYDREYSSGIKFVNGDTLFARITPCLENGKSTYVTFLNEGQVGWGSTEFIVMHAKKDLHPFLSYMLAKNIDFRDYAESCLEGSSGRQRVNIDHLLKFEIRIPNKKITQTFSSIMDNIVFKLHQNFMQIRTLNKLRDTLLPKLISGEIRVRM